MAKLIKCETDYRLYAVELTDEQLKRWKSSDEGEDEVFEEVGEEMEFVKIKDGGTEYWIEE